MSGLMHSVAANVMFVVIFFRFSALLWHRTILLWVAPCAIFLIGNIVGIAQMPPSWRSVFSGWKAPVCSS